MIATMERRLVGAAELITVLGVSRHRAYEICRHPGFPEPVADLVMGKVWELADVQRWADERGRTLLPLDAECSGVQKGAPRGRRR